MNREATRLVAVASLAFRGTLRGARVLALAGFAAIPGLIVGALVAAHTAPVELSDAAQGLFAVLTLPIIIMVIVLVISVAQFRNEIDAETLVYLSGRSVRRPTLVVGKYLGALAASLVLVVPSAVLPLGIATVGGGTPYGAAVPLAVIEVTALAALAYVALFLLLGLWTRSALIVGLLFGFFWEELLSVLPGSAPRLTLVFYLRSFLAGSLTTGPLASYPDALSAPVAASILVEVSAVLLLVAALSFRYVETVPERASA